jgi:2-aminobenzoylacetyl-CoA thioesterase
MYEQTAANLERATAARVHHGAVQLTPHLYRLGTPAFPAYLSMGDDGMIVEGGTGPTFRIMVDQIRELGIDPERIKHIVLTHTHPDHIGAVPHFQRAWPHIHLHTSAVGAKILGKTELFKQFLLVDLGIAQLMKAKTEIDSLPDPVKQYHFKVDSVVKEGDRIHLGQGIVWHVYETPGHSPCHISLYEGKEKTLVLGDSTGFYVPQKDVFWPNYFESLEKYCESIKKLARLQADRALLSHNAVIRGGVRRHLEKAMAATGKYHRETVERINGGEAPEKIAMEKARFVDSLTDIQPFRIMYDMCELMIRNSIANAEASCFEV